MFFVLSKIIVFLTDPLFYLLLFFLIYVLRSRKKFSGLMAFIFFFCISTPIVSENLMYTLEHSIKPGFSDDKKYDAVVVLGGMLDLRLSSPDRLEFTDAVERILKGVELVKSGQAKLLVLSGGSGRLFGNDPSEAVLLEKLAISQGVSPEKILIEPTSKNTFQNAQNTRKLVGERGLKNLVVISSAFHMFRVNGCFRAAGIKADLLPVDYRGSAEDFDFSSFIPSSMGLSQSSVFIHEVIGIVVYGITRKANYF